MIDSVWKSWGVSVIGPSHVQAGTPNQDSWMSRQYIWGNVLVVSDGLGSKPHSGEGSKAACLAVFQAARSYQRNPQARIVDILRLIHANWLVKIAPLTPSECSTTCLFAIHIGEVITLGRLGDGMIVVLGESKQDCLVLSDNKTDSFSNYTYSLHQEFKLNYWETTMVESSKCKAVVLCTDGISDDLLPGKEIDFVKELVGEYSCMNNYTRSQHLKNMLLDWPVPGHSDDKTIACLFNKEGFK